MTPEIRAFEYAIGVFAVLIGLAIADIATSSHRLLTFASARRTRVIYLPRNSWGPSTPCFPVSIMSKTSIW